MIARQEGRGSKTTVPEYRIHIIFFICVGKSLMGKKKETSGIRRDWARKSKIQSWQITTFVLGL